MTILSFPFESVLLCLIDIASNAVDKMKETGIKIVPYLKKYEIFLSDDYGLLSLF